MAQCSICKKPVNFLNSHRLIDGHCCEACLRQAGITDFYDSYSVTAIWNRIEKAKAHPIAEEMIAAYYEKGVAEKGFFQVEGCLALQSDYQGCWCWIRDGVFFEIYTEEGYLEAYDLDNTVHVIDDLSAMTQRDVAYVSVPVSSIQYFTKEGDIQYSTSISGGGGGGSSIAGALVGGLIAGETGAIIASRRKVEGITSVTEEHDTTKTIVKYHDGNKLTTCVFFGFDVYDYLLERIPEKELNTVQLQSAQKPQIAEQAQPNAGGVKEKIKILKELLDDGLIDEKEFAEKKAELLKQL